MEAAESNGTFEYDPNLKSTTTARNDTSTNRLIDIDDLASVFSASTVTNTNINSAKVEANANDTTKNSSTKQLTPPPPLKRKNSLDEFELEIEGINLDDNLDTSVSCEQFKANHQFKFIDLYLISVFLTISFSGCEYRRRFT